MNNSLSDVKNISAQLYEKQLHPTPKAAEWGCKNEIENPHLTTCVPGRKSDAQIENAFQDQLNLSEAYKSPLIFKSMKSDFMDQTMEKGKEDFAEPIAPLPEGPPQKPMVPSGPRDYLQHLLHFMGLSKENFGLGSDRMCIVIIVVLAILFYFLFLRK